MLSSVTAVMAYVFNAGIVYFIYFAMNQTMLMYLIMATIGDIWSQKIYVKEMHVSTLKGNNMYIYPPMYPYYMTGISQSIIHPSVYCILQ
jgi:isoprenylcysteine carboxyl methyltransferase (ICMT) family protein YpbQ